MSSSTLTTQHLPFNQILVAFNHSIKNYTSCLKSLEKSLKCTPLTYINFVKGT